MGTSGISIWTEHGVGGAGRGDVDFAEAELVAAGGCDGSAQRSGKQLGAEADSDDRRGRTIAHISGGGFAEVRHLLDEGRVVVVGGHGAAQGYDEVDFRKVGGVEGGEIGRCGVNGNGGQVEPGVLEQSGEVAAKGFDGDVLDDDGMFGHEDWPFFRARSARTRRSVGKARGSGGSAGGNHCTRSRSSDAWVWPAIRVP